MGQSITVTARELYFIGKYLHAKYIDYTYIALLPDIQRRYPLHEQQALESLEEKEILEEDFSGNIEIAEEAEEFFHPLFFGETEYVLNNGEEYRIHRDGKKMLVGQIKEEEIQFTVMKDPELERLLHGAIKLQCSDVNQGYSEVNYTAEQMMNASVRKKIISLLKGEK